MKTVIIYATKHGAAREIARRISDKMSGAEVFDVKDGSAASIDGFDCVILGSSVYAGSIHKEMKAFLAKHASALTSKRLGLYLAGIGEDGAQTYFERNFPAEVLSAACVKSFLGGIFDPAKFNFIERLIIKMVAKRTEYFDNIANDKIEKFADELQA